MIKVQIRRAWDFGGYEMIFWEERNGKIYAAKPVELVFEECPGGFTEGATLKIPHMFADQFLEAIAEALDKQGIKTDKDAKIQGTMEATKYHLEDLRKLLSLTQSEK